MRHDRYVLLGSIVPITDNSIVPTIDKFKFIKAIISKYISCAFPSNSVSQDRWLSEDLTGGMTDVYTE